MAEMSLQELKSVLSINIKRLRLECVFQGKVDTDSTRN